MLSDVNPHYLYLSAAALCVRLRPSTHGARKSSGKQPFRRGPPKELYRKSFADENSTDEF